MGRDDEVAGGGEGVPRGKRVSGLVRKERGGGRDVPAYPIFLHFPLCTLLAVEDVVGMVDVLSQFLGDFPLCIVWFCWWCADDSAGKDFAVVLKDRLAPPFQFVVWCGWKRADEGTCCGCQ